jgi:HK97 gp10 family phage protein
MDNTSVKIKGLSELLAQLNSLPERIERNVVRAALRYAVQSTFLKAVAPNIPIGKPRKDRSGRFVFGGDLAKSLRLRTINKEGRPSVGLTIGNRKVWYAHLIEKGVSPHTIKGRPFLFFGSRRIREVTHPGFEGRFFMKRAFEGNETKAVEAFKEYLQKRLPKELGKLSISK